MCHNKRRDRVTNIRKSVVHLYSYLAHLEWQAIYYPRWLGLFWGICHMELHQCEADDFECCHICTLFDAAWGLHTSVASPQVVVHEATKWGSQAGRRQCWTLCNGL